MLAYLSRIAKLRVLGSNPLIRRKRVNREKGSWVFPRPHKGFSCVIYP
jgi:hypothetical protein